MRAKIQAQQNLSLRHLPWCVRNRYLYRNLEFERILDAMNRRTEAEFAKIRHHPNRHIRELTDYGTDDYRRHPRPRKQLQYAADQDRNQSNPTSIVIIGAGAAGLSAAQKLLENGFQNIKILEAEPRIGGRIHSVYFGENVIDVGARWCHGRENNIVFSIVKDLKLLEDINKSEFFFHSSKTVIDKQFGEELIEVMQKIRSSEADHPLQYKTFGDYCTDQYQKVIHKKFSSDVNKLNIAKDALDYFELDILAVQGCNNWYHSTSQSDYQECKGNQTLNWKGRGYKTFLDVLLKTYPDSTKLWDVEKKVIVNKEVKKIIWNSKEKMQGITILCSDNTEFLADHVIVTVSIGVLKENIDTMFYPALSVEKKTAINNIGYGSVMKIALYYSNKWWNEDYHWFKFIWSEEDRRNAIFEFPDGPNLNNRSWVTYSLCFIQADANPNVLMAWFTGPLVPEMEVLSEDTLIKGLVYILKKFLGHIYIIPNPDQILQSKWYSNEHFRGVYSFQTINAKKGKNKTNAQEDLAASIKNVKGRPFVHFAGEGTHAHYYSTVHGAVESGFREADSIINYYKQNK